jgi:hypothetical protein
VRLVWFAPFQPLPHEEPQPCAGVSSIGPHWSALSNIIFSTHRHHDLIQDDQPENIDYRHNISWICGKNGG